jgi:hypothetical protein
MSLPGRTLHVSDLCPSAAVGGLYTPPRNRLFSEVTEGAGELIGGSAIRFIIVSCELTICKERKIKSVKEREENKRKERGKLKLLFPNT